MKMITILVLALALSGCGSLGNINVADAGFTYGTIKQIENGNWTQAAVLEEVANVRQQLGADLSVEIDTQNIVDSVMARVGLTDPSDRYLLGMFLRDMQSYVLEIDVPTERFQRLNDILDAVERGAMLAG